MPVWPTCPCTQEKNKNGLLSKVLNGQVSLFSSHRTIHTLIAVAFTQRKKTEILTISSTLWKENIVSSKANFVPFCIQACPYFKQILWEKNL